jgi:hypothetical protein
LTALAIPGPTRDEVDAKQSTTLDGVVYRLRFSYNQRCDCWYLDLATQDGTPIAAGRKLLCNWDLLDGCASPLRPPGMLFVRSNTTDLSPPGLEDLEDGGRCSVTYVPVADVGAAP